MADEPGVVIAGAAFAHRLYPFAFAHSGCRHVSVVIGGESFQAALWMAGGVPKEHRTDSLSATFNNLAEQEELTRNYDGLCAHFILCTDGFRATIRSEELQELLTEPDPSAACARSEALAAKRGGGRRQCHPRPAPAALACRPIASAGRSMPRSPSRCLPS